jgi:hypothetical protein
MFVCEKAAGTGTIAVIDGSYQKISVEYSGCTANIPMFGTIAVSNFKATYVLYPSGSVELGEMVLGIPALKCTTTVLPQTGPVTYGNKESGVLETHAVTGIHSTATGLCPPSSTTGTFTGSSLIKRVGGGFFRWAS